MCRWQLLSVQALGYGSLLGAVAVGTKLVTGAWEWESKWAVGWAMVGRGELGFVMVGLNSHLNSYAARQRVRAFTFSIESHVHMFLCMHFRRRKATGRG